MYVIDRRLNPSGKSLPNRQRFLRRAGKILREAVRNLSSSRPIREIGEAGVVIIPARGIDEPSFHTGSDGAHTRVLPGNKEFLEGDRIARPSGSGSGKGRGAGNNAGGGGGGEDEFKVALSAEEFLSLFLEDLELPDLERRKLSLTDSTGLRRAGYQRGGSPANLALTRTMRNALSRRMALKRPKPDEIERARQASTDADLGEDEQHSDAMRAELEALELRTRSIPYIDPIDIRYRRFEPSPRPVAQAVMFCVMDVSGSMTEHMKDIAKRFFMLLYVFLERRYKQVEIVFIRHTDEAREVDEKTFFESRETGGTRVSSALKETLRIIEERYPVDDWNIYIAQASDGDNENGDSEKSLTLMRDGLLPLSQYFAYLEVDEPHNDSPMSTLWKTYAHLEPGPSMRRVTSRQEIYPVFRELFRKRSEAEATSR
ncbi:MAG: YeaH/YhbH family protein [Beijerinckiaceae bacterium]|nr:YeaH/YhbH family protein [Beijerinckiaceae bacterium]MDO9442060.1 YeaH/YhbH family protein [Beijerinckiaceae bacterium]